MTPEVFAPGTVSTPDHEHSPLIFSPDLREAVWSVFPVPLGSGNQDIFNVYMEDDEWVGPIRIPFSSGNPRGSPTLSPAAKVLFYLEQDPDAPGDVRPRPQILWRVERSPDHGWGRRERVTDLLPQSDGRITMRFGFSDNGNLYYDLGGRRNDGQEDWGIWMRECRDGRYGAPVALGNGINDGTWNWTPFIAPDESYLIWSSNRMRTSDDGDLYISFRTADDQWTPPVTMGQTINTPGMERFPSVSPNGKYFFFVRNLPESRGDFFWVDAKVIELLRRR
jgi:hypothetical protein